MAVMRLISIWVLSFDRLPCSWCLNDSSGREMMQECKTKRDERGESQSIPLDLSPPVVIKFSFVCLDSPVLLHIGGVNSSALSPNLILWPFFAVEALSVRRDSLPGDVITST